MNIHDHVDSVDFSIEDTVVKEQFSYYNAAIKVLNILCEDLNSSFTEFTFKTLRNSNNNSKIGKHILCDRIYIVAKNKLGYPLCELDKELFRVFINDIIDHANELIVAINETIETSSIKSIILCATDDTVNRTNFITYKNRAAAKFVYSFFNTSKVLQKRLLRLMIDEEIKTLIEAKSTKRKIEYGSVVHNVEGLLIVESARNSSYKLEGTYIDSNYSNVINNRFNSTVRISNNLKNSDNIKSVLGSIKSTDTVSASVIPVQTYVCLSGVKSKNMALSSLAVKN